MKSKANPSKDNSSSSSCGASIAGISLPKWLLLSLALRIFLIAYGHIQDSLSSVRYTDVDYDVFMDAARFVAGDNRNLDLDIQAKKEESIELLTDAASPPSSFSSSPSSSSASPYRRLTYRYTPLLSWILVPGVLLQRTGDHMAEGVMGSYIALQEGREGGGKESEFEFGLIEWGGVSYPYEWALAKSLSVIGLAWGKMLFALCDLVVGWLIFKILECKKVNGKMCLAMSLCWLLNPLSFLVSTRGNAESLLASLVLATLYLVLQKRLILCAVFFGLAIHMKFFPVIYSLGLFLFLDENFEPASSSSSSSSSPHSSASTSSKTSVSSPPLSFTCSRFFNRNRLMCVLVSALTLGVLTGIMYWLYGYEFLYETYVYHIIRKDNRHNFSVYFYLLYLEFESTGMARFVSLACFIPQVVLLVILSVCFYRDIIFCCFTQTAVFVMFNKVCTSQYFNWYMCLLPLILPYQLCKNTSKLDKNGNASKLDFGLSFKRITAIAGCILFWFAGQGIWLAPAYFLEFEGRNVFMPLWASGLAFFVINCLCLCLIITNHSLRPTFVGGKML
eukprot:Nk52_evm13s328 gene=Nk52_evmTU13s328